MSRNTSHEADKMANANLDNKSRETDNSKLADDHGKATQIPIGKETKEIGGPKGPEPTRYGDWESKGRCYDF
ncbi:MAG: DUF1674 domain-containing protein [Gammaproteobacteria bacterium]|nr:DUF1674 domain-containing protein [Gammaproteobacteria bacterium]